MILPGHNHINAANQIAWRGRRLAFTMIEIAVSLGIIAFALVAIIGVLPTGLRTQQETHEDTIVNQDGPLFLEMIRGGVHGLDYLANHVEWMMVSNSTGYVVYTNENFPLSRPPGVPARRLGQITNGEIILRILSTPKFIGNDNPADLVTNTVSAYVHSLSGGASEQGRASRDLGFAYLLTTEIVPTPTLFAFSSTNYVTNDFSPLNLERSNRWLAAQQMTREIYLPTNASTYDLKVTCRWPFRPDFTTGNQRQTYRTLVSATLTNVGVPSGVFPPSRDGGPWLSDFFFIPQQFAVNP